ncbi:MAG: hypothetical protein MUF31_15750 [Akkermansiaceae bacterium]|jgi:hypothetical protein|nr:hypothetical protein [Akkermansiaceae bacterium]
MKNITLQFDGETSRKVRLQAARQGSSVSAMLRDDRMGFISTLASNAVDRISHSDSRIVAAALESGCQKTHSEDLTVITTAASGRSVRFSSHYQPTQQSIHGRIHLPA